MNRPVIGVTGPDRGGTSSWLFVRYAVRRAGGSPVRLRPSAGTAPDELDGVIITGGADVNPELYGGTTNEQGTSATPNAEPLLSSRSIQQLWHEDPWGLFVYPFTWAARKITASTAYIDPTRDILELGVLRIAVDKHLPVLGICRGEQLINVFFGGSLHRDLKDFYIETPAVHTLRPRKWIGITPGTRLSKVMRKQTECVNALHRQGVAALGNGLQVAARDKNGIVQAIEHLDFPFLVGVQWHPEYLPHHRSQRRLFEALVAEASRVRQTRWSNNTRVQSTDTAPRPSSTSSSPSRSHVTPS